MMLYVLLRQPGNYTRYSFEIFLIFSKKQFFCRFYDLVYRQINFIVCLLDMFLRMEMKIKLPLFY